MSEQLERVEEQLTALLEQQEQLLRKKKLLQAAIKTASSTVLDDTDWRKEGTVKVVLIDGDVARIKHDHW